MSDLTNSRRAVSAATILMGIAVATAANGRPVVALIAAAISAALALSVLRHLVRREDAK